ncbi:hypothetical protein AVEN_52178-1, partial [Araneus ventricosus]
FVVEISLAEELYHRSTDPYPLKERLERVYSDPDRRNGSARIQSERDGSGMNDKSLSLRVGRERNVAFAVREMPHLVD